MSATPANVDSYLAAFDRHERNTNGESPAWIHSIRRAGISRFAELGFPTTRHEEWRFTNVAPIAQGSFTPARGRPANDLTLDEIDRLGFDGLSRNRLVFVNGRCSARFSSLSALSGDVGAGSLAEALTLDAGPLEQHLTRYARCDENAFAALNTAFFEDGARVFIPQGRILEEPILLLFISTSAAEGAFVSHPRNVIVAGEGSRATVIESYVGVGDAAYLTNSVTEIVVGENARLEYCKVQAESLRAFHVATIQAHQDRNSHFLSHSISHGARLARNDIRSVLNAEGAECTFNGLYLADGEQLADHHTVIDHAKPNCASREFYNGVLSGHSRGVFNGKIFVRKDAQKTDAKQTNRNLLLSDDATVDTKPQLEIFADDVKCTHGATIGRLDEEAVFYLRSRGIGTDEARRMLVCAFASGVIQRISVEAVREQLDRLLIRRLEQETQPLAISKR
ncbi:MAG: Fe-S cluster assembly protein SufD [Verrucomicrobia bacterium]|nr:Fe-S cluster assembly protein SufD [Verrucomicrobiota bacterium]